MTRYETITGLGDNFIKLMGKNLIPVHILDWKVYYEAYLKELENLNKKHGKLKKTEAVETIAAQYDVSRRSMFHIVSFMESA